MKSILNKFLGSSYLLEPITLGGAALVAGGTALANWLFNKEQNSSNVGKSKELMDYQVNKQQQYQRWLSAMQYPSMIASLRSAGLNPNLALGGTPSQMQAGQPSAIIGQQPTKMDILGSAQALKEMELLQAQKENIEADTKEKAAGTAEKWANVDLLDQKVLTGLQTWQQEMAESKSRIALNDAQVDKLNKDIEYLGVAEDELLSKISLNFANLNWTDKQIQWYDDQMRATIKEKMAQCNFLNAQAKETMELLMYKQFNYSALTRMYNETANSQGTQQRLNSAQIGLVNVNKEAQELTNKYTRRYEDARQIIGMVTDVAKTAAQFTSAGGLLMMGLNQGKATQSLSPLSTPTFNANPSNRTFEYGGKWYKY